MTSAARVEDYAAPRCPRCGALESPGTRDGFCVLWCPRCDVVRPVARRAPPPLERLDGSLVEDHAHGRGTPRRLPRRKLTAEERREAWERKRCTVCRRHFAQHTVCSRCRRQIRLRNAQQAREARAAKRAMAEAS